MDEHDDSKLRATARRGAGTERVVAFTDGVFAIIITILVLDLRVPDLDSGQSLRQSLSDILTAAVPLAVYVAAPLPALSLVLYLAMPALYLSLVAFLEVDPRTRVAAEELS